MGRGPCIFVPAGNLRRARREAEGAYRATQTLPRPSSLFLSILPPDLPVVRLFSMLAV